MLSRGSGVAAFQRIVTRVSDLPSPLDAQSGDRIIVRETEEVYGLNSTTRMWEVIGTLKRVGGRKPEDIGAHLDSKDNPHGTTLQQVVDGGASADVGSVELRGKSKPVLRLIGDGSVLRIGPDTGDHDGVVWVNAGSRPPTAALLRFIRDKVDQFVVGGDGSVVSSGSASFAGGFRGPAHFEDEITASEGVFAAKDYDLVLGSDKSVVMRVDGSPAANFDSRGALICGSLEVSRDLVIGGLVLSNLNPQGKRNLGAPAARWESASIKSIDLAPAADQSGVVITVAPNAKKCSLLITSGVPGDTTAVTASGDLGLGTDSPERRLDVRGNGLVVGNGKSRISIDSSICFNKGPDGKPQDPSIAMWSLAPGGEADALTISRRASGGSAVELVRVTEGLISLGGKTHIAGDLDISGSLIVGGLSGHNNQSIMFNKDSATYTAGSHKFVGTVSIDGAAAISRDIVIGGSATIGGVATKALTASESVRIGTTIISDGLIRNDVAVKLESPVLSIGSELHMDGALANISVIDCLEVRGAGGTMLIGVGQYPGLSFEADTPATIYGVGEIVIESSRGSKTPAISVEQTWSGSGDFEATVINVTDEGSSNQSVLADYRVNGKRVAAVRKDRFEVAGGLNVGGLGFKKLQEDIRLDGQVTGTSFKIPAGVRVEAVILNILETVNGSRYLQVGDASDPDRFASANTSTVAGSVIRGLNHCDRGLSVQRVDGPVLISGDAPATGRVRVTVYYVDPVTM